MVSVRGSAVKYDGYKMGGWVGGWVGRWTGFVSIPYHPIHPSILLPYLSEVRPWGKPVLNVPNCSTPVAQGGAVGWGGCEALLNGTLDVLRRTTQLLNSRGKVRLLAAPRCSSPTPRSLFHPLAPPDLLTPLTLSEPHAQEPAAPCLQAATLCAAGAALRQPSVLRATARTEDLARRGAANVVICIYGRCRQCAACIALHCVSCTYTHCTTRRLTRRTRQ